MENASKALIIAGSILVAILLIAIGMKTLNSTSGSIDSQETKMNAADIAVFNNKFMSFIGNNKTASEVKALANVIIANNASNTQQKVELRIYVTSAHEGGTAINMPYTDDPGIITENASKLSKTYRILSYMNTTGRIYRINIVKPL